MHTKKRSAENKAAILKAIHRFGWLRTRDLACLVWTKWKFNSGCSDFQLSRPARANNSQLRMAQRTIKSMMAEGLLLQATGPDGSLMYALSSKGAQIISLGAHVSSSGKNLIRPPSLGYFRHRCVSNEIAITAILDGYRVSTEREIAKGSWKWGKEGLYGKMPDVLVRTKGHLYWIEVERSRRNSADYEKLIRWLIVLRTSFRVNKPLTDEAGLRLTVVFVCSKAFSEKLSADLLSRGFLPSEINFLVRFETSLYRFEVINFV